MKHPRSLVKVAALASSLAIVGGYVAYRAVDARSTAHGPARKSPEAPADAVPDAHLAGSKSAIVLEPLDAEALKQTYLGGSKSRVPIFVVPPPDRREPPK